MNSSNLLNSDRLFGIAAFLISIGTFCVYIYEARLLQKQQYASALPYLEMWNSGDTANYRLLLVNNGVGPAFIRDVKVHYKGKVSQGDHVYFLSEVAPPEYRFPFTTSNLRSGQVIPAGHEIDLVKVTDSPVHAAKLRKLLGGADAQIEITYASVYDEKWQLKGLENPPIKLDD